MALDLTADAGVATRDSTEGQGAGAAQAQDAQATTDQNLDNVPWNKDPRFRQFIEEKKAVTAEKERLAQERAAWDKGEHPHQQPWAEQKAKEIEDSNNARWTQGLTTLGLSDLYTARFQAYQSQGATQAQAQAAATRDLNAAARQETPAGLTREQVQEEVRQAVAQAQATRDLETSVSSAIAASPYAKAEGFRDKAELLMRYAMTDDLQAGKQLRSAAEYLKDVEKFAARVGAAASQQAAEAQARAQVTLRNGGTPPGMKPADAKKARLSGLMERLDAQNRAKSGG